MTKRITLNTFRKINRMEETMIRAMMPRTHAADPTPLATETLPPATAAERRVWRGGQRVAVPALTFRLQEVRQ